MEKELEKDFNFKIEVDNENQLIVSANNGNLALTAKYNKSNCRNNEITCYDYQFYGNDAINKSLLLNTLSNWVVDTHSDKF